LERCQKGCVATQKWKQAVAAGVLTEEGARLLDPAGTPHAGIHPSRPEGDAGTGMVATNSVAEQTGSVSAGTSVFQGLCRQWYGNRRQSLYPLP